MLSSNQMEYDSDCDEVPTAQASFMANFSSYGSDVLFEAVYSIKEGTMAQAKDDVSTTSGNRDSVEQRTVAQFLAKREKVDIFSPVPTAQASFMENLSKLTIFLVKNIQTNKERVVIFEQRLNIDLKKRELPKVSLVNESLKKLKYHLASFYKVVKKRTTSDAITADEITEVQTVFNQMEAAVDQCLVNKNNFEIQIKQLRINNDQLLNQIMSQEIMHIAVNSVDILDVNTSCVDECNKYLELETKLLKKKDFIEKYVYDKLFKSYSTLEKHCISLELATQLNQEIFQKDNSTLKNGLRKLKGKNIVDTTVSKPITPGMFMLDIEPISHGLKNNRDAHEDYLKKTIENTDTIHGLVECARKQNPSEPLLDSACRYTKQVQKLLVYVSKTCPSSPKLSEKLVVVTPLNKDKKVRFADPLTSSNKTQKRVNSNITIDSNKLLLNSTGVKCSTSAS
ncbi:hypothetical protein Tco_0778793 [Tanacetum coccineum]